MRVLVLLVFLTCPATFAAELSPLPPRGDDFHSEEWESYSLNTLRALFPDRAGHFEDFDFLFTDETIPTLSTHKKVDGTYLVIVSDGLVSILSSPEEYAYVVSHEFGHLTLGHAFTREGWDLHLYGLKDKEPWTRRISEEITADLFAAKRIENGFCAALQLSERALYPLFHEMHPLSREMVNERTNILRSLCTISGKRHYLEERNDEHHRAQPARYSGH